MGVHWQKRGNGYSFYFYDCVLKKNVRLKKNEIPSDIATDEQAVEFCRNKEASLDATKLRILRRIEWKKKFHNFNELVEIYHKDRVLKAPNSWKQSLFYLEHYVVTFFLHEKQCNNLNNWPVHYEAFRDWLMGVKPLKVKSKKALLAVATMNHCIKVLNTFLETMARKGKMEECRKCKAFPKSMLNIKGAEAVIPPDVSEAQHRQLEEINTTAADMYFVSLHTGLRLNELLGLSLGNVFSGEPKVDLLKKAFAQFSIETYGYIVLESQPADPKIRDGNNRVPRKPLKGKKKIAPENNRTIPITDKRAFNILVKCWKTQQGNYQNALYGDNKKDYLLFDGMNKNIYSSLLRRSAEMARVKHHPPHNARHTYSTNFVGTVFGNFTLCQMVLGHASIEITKRYVHIHEQIQRELMSSQQVEQGMEYAL